MVLKGGQHVGPQVSAAQPWTESTLTVTDAHGGSNQCSDLVNIADASPPYWKNEFNLRNATAPLTSALADISTLCIWPPNFKYYCWLDVTSNDNDQVCFPLSRAAVGSMHCGTPCCSLGSTSRPCHGAQQSCLSNVFVPPP
jgi:hypothetical protein